MKHFVFSHRSLNENLNKTFRDIIKLIKCTKKLKENYEKVFYISELDVNKSLKTKFCLPQKTCVCAPEASSSQEFANNFDINCISRK